MEFQENKDIFSNLRNDGELEQQEKEEDAVRDSQPAQYNEALETDDHLHQEVNESSNQDPNYQLESVDELVKKNNQEHDIETFETTGEDILPNENINYQNDNIKESINSQKDESENESKEIETYFDQNNDKDAQYEKQKEETENYQSSFEKAPVFHGPMPTADRHQNPTSSESDFASDDELRKIDKADVKKYSDSSSSSSSDNENDEIEDDQKLQQYVPDVNHDQNEQTNQLHGLNENNLLSTEEISPETFTHEPDLEPKENIVQETNLAESLKQALKERENEHQDDIDDTLLRARSASDFNNFDIPPALPPKMSIPPVLPPKAKNLSTTNDLPVFYVRDKTASLGRGGWSDDDDGVAPPEPHKKKPLHPPPDRVIDFRNDAPSDDKKSLSRRNQSDRRQRNKASRIIDIPRRPTEDINEVFKRQAMVSLHSSAPFNRPDGRDPYDTVHNDDEGDLSRLIHEANSLEVNQLQQEKNFVDVLFPSFQRSNPPPQNFSLTPSYPDAFVKIASTSKTLKTKSGQSFPEEPTLFSSNSYNHSKSMPRKYKLGKDSSFPVFLDPQDGDDEISLEDSDIHFLKPVEQQPKSLLDQQSYLYEVSPTDYTEFDSDPETENDLSKFQDRDVGSYDSVLETDAENPDKENQLNPIVNKDYQICTSLQPSHNTFPRRFRAAKPKPKERSSMNVMAVALTDPSTNTIQPSSFNINSGQLRRNKSIPIMKSDSGAASLFGQTPHIVVTRDRSRSSGGPLSDINGPLSLPVRKKSKHKKEDSGKIRKSYSGQFENDIKLPSNTGSLQINLLPSDDPNVINLNISTATGKQKVSVGQQSAPESLPDVNFDPSPLALQPLQPITAVSHKITPPTAEPLEESNDQDSQHRVVEIAPVVIESAPLNPEPMQLTLVGNTQQTTPKDVSIVPAEMPQTVPLVPLTTEIIQQPIPAQRHIVPVEVYPVQNQESVSPVTPSAPEIEVIQRTISTQQTKTFNQTATDRNQQPQSAIIEIKHPSWEDKTLPSEPPSNGSGLKNCGDSGIDVTNYKKSRRRRHSSSDESSYDPKRSSSKRKLKDYADENKDPDLADEYVAWYKRTYLKPRCCYWCLKHFIFVINLLFGVIGLALIGLGIWGFADLYYNGLNNPMLLLRDPVFPIFIVGIVLTLICFEGAIGFFRDNICMIKIFGWLLVLLCLVFIGGGAAFWVLRTSQVTPFVMNNFLDMIKTYNTTTRKVAAFTLNQMQANLDCCGINSYSDWNTLTEYPCRDSVCMVPSSCCSRGHKVCSRNEAEGQVRTLDACKNAMTLWLKNNTAIVVGAWILVICLFVLNFISIHFMVREILYLQAIEDKIHSINDPDLYRSDLTSSDDFTSSETDSEEERRRRRRRRRRRKRRRERRERKNYHTNKAYR